MGRPIIRIQLNLHGGYDANRENRAPKCVRIPMGHLIGPNQVARYDFCHNKVFQNSQTLNIELGTVIDTLRAPNG